MYCTTAVVGLISPNSVYLLNFLRALLLAKLLGAFIESMTALVHSKNELNIVHTAPVEAKKGFCSFATESFRKNELLFLYGLASSSVYVVPSANVINAWLVQEVGSSNLSKYLTSTTAVALVSSSVSIIATLIAARTANRYLKGMRMYSKSFGVCLFTFMAGVQPFIFTLVETYLVNNNISLTSIVDPRLNTLASITILESLLVVVETVICSILIYRGFDWNLVAGTVVKRNQVAPEP